MTSVKYPENVELKKALRHGDLKVISLASKKSQTYIEMIFRGDRRMTSRIKEVYDTVVRFNQELAAAFDSIEATR
ncbi:MAG: hypothetical protein A3K54_00185 [Omnitrophica WOR_2 bacterium RBG_13_44_8]|nr:MAG: hypothetical protein A3K54_00185 [Omnitrophica WOR_2 bacterium RBG_13_44_8]